MAVTALTASELARTLDINPANVNMAVRRGSLIRRKDKRIDIAHPVNTDWIEKQKDNGKPFDLNRIYTKEKHVPQESKETVFLNIPEDAEEAKTARKLLLKKKILEVQKLEHDTTLKQLEIEKKRGALVPVEAVKNIFMYALETFKNKYLQEAKSMADIIVQIMGGSHTDLIRIQKELTENINDSHIDAKTQLVEGVAAVVEEYQEVRGRGEKK